MAKSPPPHAVAWGLTPAHLERLILDELYFHARFRNVSDRAAEVTWNSGIEGTMTYVDKLHDDLFREVRERNRDADMLELVNLFQIAFRSVVRSLIRRGVVNAFTDGFTVVPGMRVPLPNRHSSSRPRLRVRGLTLTAKGYRQARRAFPDRYA